MSTLKKVVRVGNHVTYLYTFIGLLALQYAFVVLIVFKLIHFKLN